MTQVSADVAEFVRLRAAARCEYCRMHQALQGATFHIEHIVPTSKGGATQPDNLAWACPSCNLHKADRIDAVDPADGQRLPLFHPRSARWTEHFRWNAYEVEGITATGRAAVAVLHFNDPRRLLIRQAEEVFGLFPP